MTVWKLLSEKQYSVQVDFSIEVRSTFTFGQLSTIELVSLVSRLRKLSTIKLHYWGWLIGTFQFL